MFGEIVVPTLMVLVGFAFVVMMRDLFGYADWLVNRGLGAAEVGQIAAYRLLPVLGQTLPFALLLGAPDGPGTARGGPGAALHGGQRRLRAAADGAGAGLLRLATAVALAVSLLGAPWAARSLDAALLRAAAANPTTALRPGQVRHFGDWRLEAREVSPRGDALRGVMLWAPALGETVFAEAAKVEPEAGGQVRLTLEEGVVVVHGDDGQATRARFRRMVERLEEPAEEEAAPGDPLDRASLAELRAQAEGIRDLRGSRHVEAALQRRFALPVTALVFGLLAVPLFLSRTRPSRSSGAAMGVVVGVAWFALLQLGGGLLYIEALPVAVGVWLPLGRARAAGRAARLARRPPHPGRPQLGARRGGAGRGPARPGRLVLHRYVLGLFLRTAGMAFVGLLAAYLLVDVLDNLKWFTKYQSTMGEVARFYAARAPLLASRVFPVALLVASSLTVSLLAVNGELIAMRACGISSLRIIGPALVLCGALAAGYYLVADRVLPRTNALAQEIKRTEIKGQPLTRSSAWYRSGDKLYQAELLDPLLGMAQDVVMYQLDAQGLPRSRTDAPMARHIGDGVWRMVDPVRIELDGGLSKGPVEASRSWARTSRRSSSRDISRWRS